VTSLVAPGVVNTMPEATLRAVADHGQVPADSIHGHYDEARQALARLQALGIDYEDIMQGLEDDAVAKFEAAWQQLADQLAATLRAQPDRQHRSQP
jgi:transaldolase